MWNIKPGYQQRKKAEYYEQKESTRTHQPHVYEFAEYLCERSGAGYLIDIGCGNGVKTKDFSPSVKKIGVDFGSNLEAYKNNNPEAKTIVVDLETNNPEIDDEIIENSVVVCSDVLEHLHNPGRLLEYLSKLSNQALFVLVSTPDRIRLNGIGDQGPPKNHNHLREWSSDELHSLFCEYDFKAGDWGYTVNNNELLNKTTTLYIGGKLNGFGTEGTRDLKAVAIMSVFNERDIAIQAIKHYINQGLHVHVIDNWSDNGIFETIYELAENSTNLSVERFPAGGKVNVRMWKELLERKTAYALESGFDWGIHVDADELRYTPWSRVSLLDGIKIVDALGFNAIDFSVLEFRPTKEGFAHDIDPKEFFHHFEFGKAPGSFSQIKAWKIYPETDYDLTRNGGHDMQFSGQKVFPLKFENQHFAYRSLEQIREKLYVERLPRIEENLMKYGWHVHFVDFAVKHGVKIWEADKLLTDSRLTRQEYLIERLSGIGLPRERIDVEKVRKLYSYWKKGRIESFDDLSLKLLDELEEKDNEINEIKNTLSWRLMIWLLPVRNIYVKVKEKLLSKFSG